MLFSYEYNTYILVNTEARYTESDTALTCV